MINSEIIAIIIVLFIYTVIGSMIARRTYKAIDNNVMCVFEGEKIISDENLDFVGQNKLGLSLIVGFLWIFYAAFSIWIEIGRETYNEVIIGEDEEDRIASWVV